MALMLLFSDTVYYTTSQADSHVNVQYDQTRINAPDGEEVLNNMPLISVLAGIAILGFASILLFKDRRLQASVTAFNFVAIIALLIFMYIASFSRHYFEESGSLTFYALIPVIMIFFNYLGLRGIRRDERLVRSMDRFR